MISWRLSGWSESVGHSTVSFCEQGMLTTEMTSRFSRPRIGLGITDFSGAGDCKMIAVFHKRKPEGGHLGSTLAHSARNLPFLGIATETSVLK